jgi:hypothetical protein
VKYPGASNTPELNNLINQRKLYTVKLIKQMEDYYNSDVDRTSKEYREKMAFYEKMIKNPPRLTFNHDFKGWKKLMDLIVLRKDGVSYGPERASLDSAQIYLDKIKKK